MARGATRVLIVLFALCFAGEFGPASAQSRRERLTDPFEITADRIEYDGPRDLYVATGRVQVLQVDRRLRADWVAFSTTTRLGVAEGGVELVDGDDALQAEFMVFDVDSLRGMLFEGGLDAGSQGFKVRAAELVRTGANTFTARDGRFTTCRCEEGDRLPWEIVAGEADIEVGDYGTVQNATFDVLGVPVLWIPWAFFPVKSERETGFLLPQIELGGRSGFGAGLPFFWAAHEQLNVILTPRGYSERGFKGDAEVEYVFGEQSEGDLFVAGLNDQREEDQDDLRATSPERWGVKWFHDQFLPAGFRWTTDLKLSSDNFYSDDFEEFREYRADRFIESTTNVHRDFGPSGGFGVLAGARYADDVQGLAVPEAPGVFEFEDNDDSLLQRFGEGRADVLPGAATAPLGIEFRFDSQVIHFRSTRDHQELYRNGAAPLVPVVADGRFYDFGVDGNPAVQPSPLEGSGDGIFQPGEVIAEHGTRAILHPRLARPFRVGSLFEVVPEVGWQQVFYDTDERGYAERGLLTGRVDLRARLAREFARGPGTLRHVIEPRLGWAFVSAVAQDRNPLFVPQGTVEQARLRAFSLDSVTRDPSDRVENANEIVLGVAQRFYRRRGARGPLALSAQIETAIDFDAARHDLGRLYLDGSFFNLFGATARIGGAFNPQLARLDEARADVGYRRRFDNPWIRLVRLNVGYRFRERIPTFLESNRGLTLINETDRVNQINFSEEVELTRRFRLRHRLIYKLGGEDEILRNEGTVEYASKCRCWTLGVTVAFDRNDQISGGFNLRFVGLGDDGSSLFGSGFGTGVGF